MASKTYAIDPAHSDVTFQVRHLLSKVRGRFTAFSGTIQFDAAAPTQSTVNFTVDVASIDTAQADRDAHLKGDDFFAVETHPTLTFTSRSITATGGTTYTVQGDLTIRGVTKATAIPVEYLGVAKDPWGNEKIGFEARVTLNRKDFGLTWNAALETGGVLVGDEVVVENSLQAA